MLRRATAEAAATALACLDGAAAMLEDIGVEMRRQWRYLKAAPDGPLSPLANFFGGVNLAEPWVFTLMLFHIGLVTVAIKSRDDSIMQTSIFTFGLAGVYFAEKLNRFFGRHWWRFSRRPYFDEDGAFLCTVWSGPLLLVGTVILANTIYTLAQVVMQWKKTQRKHQTQRS